MNTELRKNHERLMAEFRSLGIRPQMKVSQGGNTSSTNTFDLRSLNQKLIKKW